MNGMPDLRAVCEFLRALFDHKISFNGIELRSEFHKIVR